MDCALSFALSEKNKILFAEVLKNDFNFMVKDLCIPLSYLIENIQIMKDLTLFSKNRLAFLRLIQNDSNLFKGKEFSASESKTIHQLTYNIYKANMNMPYVDSQLSIHLLEFQDMKKMHAAATKIQFWVRNKLAEKTATSPNGENNNQITLK